MGLSNAVVLGHSLGGVNACQLAARHPRLVRSLIAEGIGAEVDDDLSFSPSWPNRAPTRERLLEELDPSAGYVTDAIREYADGWGLAFSPQDTNASQRRLDGNHRKVPQFIVVTAESPTCETGMKTLHGCAI
ncbi:alpha/beta hydrolase [Streptomyces sp. NBC_00057]|uniref:alpha/beta hydrolase n=1 Tax=Streptomyces sp. NBC_00057 TaxID=2975634 RepID=UPI0032488294